MISLLEALELYAGRKTWFDKLIGFDKGQSTWTFQLPFGKTDNRYGLPSKEREISDKRT